MVTDTKPDCTIFQKKKQVGRFDMIYMPVTLRLMRLAAR